MGSAQEDLAQAASLPEGDVIRILLEQHARIRELFSAVRTSTGERKQESFDELRGLLAVHETAEEMVLRPVSRVTAGKEVAQARNDEEAEATKVLAELEKLDITSPEFDRTLRKLEKSVTEHAEHEEKQEFPAILSQRDEGRRADMGKALRAAEKAGPTHPHTSTAGSSAKQWVAGPFAAMVDKVRDTLRSHH
jgi:hemerythrin superfamily protein